MYMQYLLSQCDMSYRNIPAVGTNETGIGIGVGIGIGIPILYQYGQNRVSRHFD